VKAAKYRYTTCKLMSKTWANICDLVFPVERRTGPKTIMEDRKEGEKVNGDDLITTHQVNLGKTKKGD